MSYDVVLESVSAGFHGPVVAALLTVRIPSRTVWKEVAGFRTSTTVGLGLDPVKAPRGGSQMISADPDLSHGDQILRLHRRSNALPHHFHHRRIEIVSNNFLWKNTTDWIASSHPCTMIAMRTAP